MVDDSAVGLMIVVADEIICQKYDVCPCYIDSLMSCLTSLMLALNEPCPIYDVQVAVMISKCRQDGS